jgi:hypothetical protein
MLLIISTWPKNAGINAGFLKKMDNNFQGVLNLPVQLT